MPREGDIAARYAKENDAEKGSLGQQYGTAVALMASGKNQQAAEILYDLVQKHANLTLLRVVESGFDAIPAIRRDEAFKMNSGGWDEQMKNIEKHVATT